jgi:selenide,water dikinase
VDNPRHFGRIAAANAVSDVYAMGGTPLLALSVLGMPINKLPTEVIQVGEGKGMSSIPLAGPGSV